MIAMQIKVPPITQLPLPPHITLSPTGLVYALLASALLAGGLIVLAVLLRKLLRSDSEPLSSDWHTAQPGTENASAFMAASMQGVIEKLRAQEKELARLHQLAQERAQESERLTEEVTRNMPTGLLLVSATGAISSTNPAAEEALGVRPLRYRSYKEILGGADSELAQLLTACLHEGKTFHRGEVEHQTADGEVRRLGVTISPIYRFPRSGQASHATPLSRVWGQAALPGAKVSGALCLMSDLTELAALQKQIRWKENLAALGEMSAGIAHEFKNALATISGLRADDSQRSQARRHTRFGGAHSGSDQSTHARGDGIPALRKTAGNLLRNRAHAQPDGKAGAGNAGSHAGVPGRSRRPIRGLARGRSAAAAGAGEPDAKRDRSGHRGGSRHRRVGISGTIEHLGGREWQRICVSDNGPGIPEIDLPKIFLPFYTTKAEGTGLGLAVVQKVALQHGGSIEARNRADGGADFLLWLPLRQEPSPSLFPPQAARI